MESNKTLIIIFLVICMLDLCCPGPLTSTTDKAEEEAPDDVEQRSKLIAFLLSFFLGGFGAEWFYLSRGFQTYILVGIVKFLLVSLAGFCFFSFNLKMCKCDVGALVPCLWIVRLFIFLWWVVDWARVLTNTFPDGSGMELLQDL